MVGKRGRHLNCLHAAYFKIAFIVSNLCVSSYILHTYFLYYINRLTATCLYLWKLIGVIVVSLSLMLNQVSDIILNMLISSLVMFPLCYSLLILWLYPNPNLPNPGALSEVELYFRRVCLWNCSRHGIMFAPIVYMILFIFNYQDFNNIDWIMPVEVLLVFNIFIVLAVDSDKSIVDALIPSGLRLILLNLGLLVDFSLNLFICVKQTLFVYSNSLVNDVLLASGTRVPLTFFFLYLQTLFYICKSAATYFCWQIIFISVNILNPLRFIKATRGLWNDFMRNSSPVMLAVRERYDGPAIWLVAPIVITFIISFFPSGVILLDSRYNKYIEQYIYFMYVYILFILYLTWIYT
jgi:hypothetical protein